MWYVLCHVSCVMCHVSCVMCDASFVMYDVSRVMCDIVTCFVLCMAGSCVMCYVSMCTPWSYSLVMGTSTTTSFISWWISCSMVLTYSISMSSLINVMLCHVMLCHIMSCHVIPSVVLSSIICHCHVSMMWHIISYDESRNSAGIDLVICPVMPFPAIKHGHFKDVTFGVSYTALYNVLDYPAGTNVIWKDCVGWWHDMFMLWHVMFLSILGVVPITTVKETDVYE